MSSAVAVSFDNLGEVSDLERGRWPAHEPLGRHFSVTRALPRVLDLLAALELRGTFFVEGLNAELYPAALGAIAAAGHEIGYHGWRHEPWSELSPDREAALLTRGIDALASLDLRPLGFRPPGGALAPSSWSALAEAGFTYCSPAGTGIGVREGLAVLPFRWELIDAFHYLPHFGARRRAALGAEDVLAPAAFEARVSAALREGARAGGVLTLLFHPFLADTAERLEAMHRVLSAVRALVDAGAVRCAPMRELAADLLARPAAGSAALVLDES